MKFSEVKNAVLDGEAFEGCVWRKSWTYKDVDDCPCVMKDYNGELYVYPSPFFNEDSVKSWQLTEEDFAADDWVGDNN